jgi:polygalacturonase
MGVLAVVSLMAAWIAGCGTAGSSTTDGGAGAASATGTPEAGGLGGPALDGGSGNGDSGGTSTGTSTGTGTGTGDGGGTGSSGIGPGCGRDDPALAGLEPAMPSAVCQTPSPGADIQAALDACAGHGAVKLTGAPSFSASSLTLAAGAILWIDGGVVLNLTGSATPGLIEVTGAGAGIYGEGTIDAKGAASGTTMIHSAGDGFVLYRVHLHNSQKMNLKVQGKGFVIWGNTILAAPSSANTDGIDPGAGKQGVDTTGGYIVCNAISVGDDQIAIKGTQGHVSNLTVAHNYFGAGHGMSIGSETGPGGIDGVNVYDLTIDGDVYPAASAVNANGIRIKSYDGAGGVVDHVSYRNICARNLHDAILITPSYTQGTVTSGGIPVFGSVTIADYHVLRGSGSQTPAISITGTTGTPATTVTLDDVVVDGLTTPISATSATVTVGPGGASPGVNGPTDGTPQPIDCSARFVTFPAN